MACEEYSLSQGNFISAHPETTGFDLSSGAKWIYPENYPRRDYQFNIVQTALYHNTLVCLPTGLGKTFIAAVVMYNFWRWYPRGRVVFLAPTKPLVAQQIEACHEIMGIPSEQTIELTGAINQTKRRQAWTQKRVIFATPQTFQKDLQNDCVPCDLIKCIVIDEAHKALGKHSYCEIIRMVNEKNRFFRVLALSATPGSKIDHVREVIQNLLISQLELRDDMSPDITPYTNDRSMEKIIVGLGKDLNDYKERYLSIMDPHVRILMKNQLVQGNAANISKGRIFMLMKQIESRPQKSNNHGVIMKTLNILLTMYHAYELLIKHGLRAFYNFYSNKTDKFWLEAEVGLHHLLEDIKGYIGDFPVIQLSPDSTIPDIPDNLVFGHGKFDKLRELLIKHFQSYQNQNKSTRAIVFVEYRDIVNEVFVLLLQSRPLIRPQMFVGQAGQKQKHQLAALEDFRNNKVNVLISTSVGEEGLDVGEVDLIVCFDISSSTPTRLVQRMGRTGRKRSGRVVILLTEGKEVQTLNQAMSKKDSLNSKVLQSSNIISALYQSSPRMIPVNINPQCMAIFIKTQPKTPKVKGKRTKAVAEKTTAPVVKKPRKNKKDIAVCETESMSQLSSSKAISSTKSSGSTQSSMMKFLTDQRQQKKNPQSYAYDCDIDSGIPFCEEFRNPENKRNTAENPYEVIKPSDVKLLTSDSHALEFLTFCAMKKSEQRDAVERDDIFRIDRSWIPSLSPPPSPLLRDFVVPSIDILDCINDLTLYEKPLNDDLDMVNSDESQCNFPIDNEDTFSGNRVSNYFGGYSPIESKYVKAHEADLRKQDEEVEVSESDFLDDFSSVETRHHQPLGNINSREQEIEIEVSDFDFSSFDSRYRSPEKSNNTSSKKQEDTGVDINDSSTSDSMCLVSQKKEDSKKQNNNNLDINNFSTFASKCLPLDIPKIRSLKGQDDSNFCASDFSISEKVSEQSASSQESAVRTPANIEFDFENILDEYTESEASESYRTEEPNIFDELLDADTSDEDPFDCNESQNNVTVIPNDRNDVTISFDKQKDHTLVADPMRLSFKRSASQSPFRESLVKKQRIGEVDSSDSECAFVMATPPKLKNRSFLEPIKEAPKSEVEVSYPDSEEDMFEDLDSNMQFTLGDEKEQLPFIKEEKIALSEKEIVPIEEVPVKEEMNELLLHDHANRNVEENEVFLNQDTDRDEKKSIKKNPDVFDLKFDNMNVPEINLIQNESSIIKNKNESSMKSRIEEPQPSRSEMDTSDLIFDDWKDDFVYAVQKKEIEQEEVSSFFSTNAKANSLMSRSQQNSFSTGWISVDSTNKTTSQPKKVLNPKNTNPVVSSKSNSKSPFDQSMAVSKQFDLSNKSNNEPRIMSAQVNFARPSSSRLRLKCNLADRFGNRDKDGFALPQSKVSYGSKPNTRVPEIKPDENSSDEENELPIGFKARQRKKRDNSISPRFRKYHSENNLSTSKSRKGVKKREKKKKVRNNFIDDEAEVSSDLDTSEGSSNDEDCDKEMDSFVSYTQDVPDEVDMRAHYLRTMKSPIRAGGFVFKNVRNVVPDYEVYSQPVTQSQVHETYEQDSFCIGDEMHIDDNESDNDCTSNYSVLENYESILESRREALSRKKSMKRAKFKCLKNKMKKKIKKELSSNSDTSNTSTSEDETEKLRKQVLEESMRLKRK